MRVNENPDRRNENMNDTTKTLIDLLRRAAAMGLTFDRGMAYISAAYIEEQKRLRDEIDRAIAAAEAAAAGL